MAVASYALVQASPTQEECDDDEEDVHCQEIGCSKAGGLTCLLGKLLCRGCDFQMTRQNNVPVYRSVCMNVDLPLLMQFSLAEKTGPQRALAEQMHDMHGTPISLGKATFDQLHDKCSLSWPRGFKISQEHVCYTLLARFSIFLPYSL